VVVGTQRKQGRGRTHAPDLQLLCLGLLVVSTEVQTGLAWAWATRCRLMPLPSPPAVCKASISKQAGVRGRVA
jgi:hypothetical protein